MGLTNAGINMHCRRWPLPVFALHMQVSGLSQNEQNRPDQCPILLMCCAVSIGCQVLQVVPSVTGASSVFYD